MKIYKACKNTNCDSMNKRLKCNFSDKFCTKCGKPLFHICYECEKVIDEGSAKFCADCVAKHEQEKQERADKVKDAAQHVPAVASFVVTVAKEVPKIVKAISKK